MGVAGVKAWQERAGVWVVEITASVRNFDPVDVLHPV
jgi:hypothetical protein